MEKGLTIEEVLGETFETYLTTEEAEVIRDAFRGNKKLLKALQKIFLPTVQDPEMPAESMAEDFWMSGKQWDNIPADECKALVVARQDTIKHVLGGILRIKAIMNVQDGDLQKIADKRRKDSAK
jgi:hypothetical protein